MEDLRYQDRILLEAISKRKPRKRNQGYYYYCYKGKYYKRSRVLIQLSLNKKLSLSEIVHHKDRNKENDSLDNLEVLNCDLHNALDKGKPKGWKPANTLKPLVVDRIRKLASEMVKINYSEISRKLAKEGIKVSDYTIGRYLKS